MSGEPGKSGTNVLTDDLVTNVFNELSSAGFLEQLRLECVANVKTMSTYLQLKKRFVDLLNKKLSNADWKFEKSAPRLSILREQIVECSVLAVTIERVVDEVVSLKVREQIVPIIKEILCACYDQKEVSKLKLNNISGSNPSFAQLKQVIKKICDHIHVDWKHVFKDQVIGKSLAAVSFSTSTSQQSDDDDDSSEDSDSDDLVEIIESPTNKRNKRKIESITVEEDEKEDFRSKRERKKNSKYFSDDFQTNIPFPEPHETSTPEPSKVHFTPKKHCKNVTPYKSSTPEPSKVQSTPKKHSENVFAHKSLPSEPSKTYSTPKKHSENVIAHKSLPPEPSKTYSTPKKHSENISTTKKTSKVEKKISPIKISCKKGLNITDGVVKLEKDEFDCKSPDSTSSPSPNKTSSSNNAKSGSSRNGLVRKSERQPKPNTRFFWEPGESPQKTRISIAEQEADDDLRQMELSIIKSEQHNGDIDNNHKKSYEISGKKKKKH